MLHKLKNNICFFVLSSIQNQLVNFLSTIEKIRYKSEFAKLCSVPQ